MRFAVTPYAGVWIEIASKLLFANCVAVTPYAGVWIEIDFVLDDYESVKSLPTRECGLKY